MPFEAAASVEPANSKPTQIDTDSFKNKEAPTPIKQRERSMDSLILPEESSRKVPSGFGAETRQVRRSDRQSDPLKARFVTWVWVKTRVTVTPKWSPVKTCGLVV